MYPKLTSIVEQELLTLLEYLSLSPVSRWIRVVQCLDFCAVFCGSLFVVFLLTLVLYVLL